MTNWRGDERSEIEKDRKARINEEEKRRGRRVEKRTEEKRREERGRRSRRTKKRSVPVNLSIEGFVSISQPNPPMSDMDVVARGKVAPRSPRLIPPHPTPPHLTRSAGMLLCYVKKFLSISYIHAHCSDRFSDTCSSV